MCVCVWVCASVCARSESSRNDVNMGNFTIELTFFVKGYVKRRGLTKKHVVLIIYLLEKSV